MLNIQGTLLYHDLSTHIKLTQLAVSHSMLCRHHWRSDQCDNINSGGSEDWGRCQWIFLWSGEGTGWHSDQTCGRSPGFCLRNSTNCPRHGQPKQQVFVSQLCIQVVFSIMEEDDRNIYMNASSVAFCMALFQLQGARACAQAGIENRITFFITKAANQSGKIDEKTDFGNDAVMSIAPRLQ